MVARMHDDEVTVLYSVGIAHPVGKTVPFSESFTRHVFGTNDVLAFSESQKDEWENDPAQKRERWSAGIVTTAYADGVAVGGLIFYSLRPRGKAFTDADRDFVRVVASMMGASLERERREEELEAIAYADPLTRLPNRRYVLEHLKGAIARADRNGEYVAVYYIDLDGFKEINDLYGHATGDELLVLTAARLRQVVREGDVLGRVGGDEFVVVQSVEPSAHNELRLGNRLIAAACEPAIFQGRSLAVSASVGIVVGPTHAKTADEAIEHADQAMYVSKRAGGGRATVYSADAIING
jgi:diguanylate cyclase (GGDEF)-like protein